MLNRRTIAKISITNTERETRKDNHNKIVYLPLITTTVTTTGDGRSSLFVSSSINNNTDAILTERQNKVRDSQIKQQISSRQVLAKKSHKIRVCSNLNICQSPTYNPTKANLTTARKQLVNSKTNFIIENYCVNNTPRGSPRSTIKSKMVSPIYYLTALLFALCAISLAPISVQADSLLSNVLQKSKIYPEIIKESDIYTIKLELNGNTVKPGDSIPAKYVKDLNILKINWDGSYPDDRTTVMIVDLDRKLGQNTTQSIYNQFTSLNIPGTSIGAGQTIVAFEPPIVSCNPSAKHRILLLALKQRQNIDLKDIFYMSASSGHSQSRENFKLNEFIERHRLEIVAANVLYAYGETNGVCNGGLTLHSIQNLSSILIAMVMLMTAFGIRTITY